MFPHLDIWTMLTSNFDDTRMSRDLLKYRFVCLFRFVCLLEKVHPQYERVLQRGKILDVELIVSIRYSWELVWH